MVPTQSVYEITSTHDRIAAIDYMRDMKIIMVKGIGYAVVSPSMENPDLFVRMGEAVAARYQPPKISRDEYYSLVEAELPELNVRVLYTTAQQGTTDIINLVAKTLFVKGDTNSKLAVETRNQLEHLKEYGVLNFA